MDRTDSATCWDLSTESISTWNSSTLSAKPPASDKSTDYLENNLQNDFFFLKANTQLLLFLVFSHSSITASALCVDSEKQNRRVLVPDEGEVNKHGRKCFLVFFSPLSLHLSNQKNKRLLLLLAN